MEIGRGDPPPARVVGRQEGVDLGLRLGNIDALDRVRENESVDADHHGHRELFREAEGLDVQVERLLVGLREELHPTGIPHGHRIGMVVPDVDGRADRAVAERHDDRQAEPGGVVDRLRHEEEALARGRGVGAGSRRRGADRDRERREFELHVDELALLEVAGAHHFAQGFDDVGLGRDGIGADDLGPAERDALRHAAAIPRSASACVIPFHAPSRPASIIVRGGRGGNVRLRDHGGNAWRMAVTTDSNIAPPRSAPRRRREAPR